MAEVSLYQKPGLTPGNPNATDGTSQRILGTVAYSDVETSIMALEWYAPTTLPAFASLALWELTGDNPNATTGTRLDLMNFVVGSMTGGTWNRLTLPAPRLWAANKPFYGQVHTDDHYVFSDPTTWPFSSADGTLHTYTEATGGNGRWTNEAGANVVANTNHPGGSGYNFFVNIITDVMAGETPEIFTFGTPNTPDQTDSNQIYTLGRVFRSNAAGSVKGIRWRAPTNAPLTKCRMVLYEVGNTTPLAQSALFTATVGVNNDVYFTSSYSMLANTDYIACVVTDRYAFTAGGWPFTSSPGGNLTATAGSGATANGRLGFTGTPGTEGVPTYPGTASGTSADFFISPIVVVTAAPTDPINQVTETGIVFPVVRNKIFTVNQVTETGIVLPVGKAKARVIGQVTEVGSVFSVTKAQVVSAEIGQILEFGSPGRLGLAPSIDTYITREIDRTEIVIEAGRTEIEF